ncbi:MAG: HAMP domain-containing protein, partial [Candidatus Limnocylindrales bacterium]|nr:HAMP domain-containing protein [Candidatus Limnocylindrales bacterium]
MPRSLTGRIVLVVALPIIAAWLAMGLALTVILASLHADATKSSLADIGQTLIVRFRNAALDRELRAVVAEVREAVAGSGIEVHLLRTDGTYQDLGETADAAVPGTPIAIPAGAVRGQTLTGSIDFTDGEQHLYASTVLRPSGVAGPRAIVLSRPDRSRAEALVDLVKALPLALVMSAAVGLPLVLLLVRSVGGPLRRLAEATADLPQGDHHRPLPLEGPGEVRELTARFNAMAEELEVARVRETALLADLRHDLRTPLTVIAGYAAALADGTASGDEALRAARTIGDEAARLERLVDELGAVER